MRGDDDSGNGILVRVERAMLGILQRPGTGSEHDDGVRRDLQTLFMLLTPGEANALVRRHGAKIH